MFQALTKNLARNFRQLGFRIMQVEEVNGLEAQIFAGAFDLVAQVVGRNAMHAAHHLLRVHDSALDVFLQEIAARIRREVAVKREISGFGGDENFLPGDVSAGEQPGQGGPIFRSERWWR
jgi:hypothetical protein